MITGPDLGLLTAATFENAVVYHRDNVYRSPDKDWVTDELYFKGYQKWLHENNAGNWRETWDCDDFSRSFKLYAQLCHHRQAQLDRHKLPEGISIGVIEYHTDGGGVHSANIIYTEGVLKFFEPQTGKYIELSETEKDRCFYILF